MILTHIMFIGKYDKVYKVTTTINILTSWKQTFMLISAMQFGCHFTFCFDFNICFFLSTIALEWTFKKLKYFTHSAAVNFAANMPIMLTANYLTYKLIVKLGSCSNTVVATRTFTGLKPSKPGTVLETARPEDSKTSPTC